MSCVWHFGYPARSCEICNSSGSHLRCFYSECKGIQMRENLNSSKIECDTCHTQALVCMGFGCRKTWGDYKYCQGPYSKNGDEAYCKEHYEIRHSEFWKASLPKSGLIRMKIKFNKHLLQNTQ